MFIPDRNQDDIPDGEPEILLDGFEGDVIRHNIVNGLRWGPDGWLYGRHGIQATSFVGAPGSTESQRVPMNCAIWRYHPTAHVFEIVAQGGTNSWGFDYDENGEMFMINTVIGHLFHVVPNARYRRMYGSHFNPHLYQVIEQTADHFHWDVGEEHWAVTKKEGMSDGTDRAGGGHAHTGLMIYQGDNWPAEFHNRLFTANFHGRRINSDSIQRDGNSYVAHHGPDYFITADPWFRGVEMIYGSDGGVFLLDWSDIGECHENDGIHRTSGRIFKLTYRDPQPPMRRDLRQLRDDQLVQLLLAPNEWYPRQARRLLQERSSELQLKIANPDLTEDQQRELRAQATSLTDSLISIYENCNDVKQKLRVLWAIYSTNPGPESWWLAQTNDDNEHVRAWAVRLLADGQIPITAKIASRFQQLAQEDASGLVRLYVASSLPRFEAAEVFGIANRLALHESDADDRVQPKLIWYGVEPHVVSDPLRAIQLATQGKMPLLTTNIARRLTNEIEHQPDAIERILSVVSQTSDIQLRVNLLEGMAQGLNGWNRAPLPATWSSVAASLASEKNERIAELVQSLNIVFGDGRAMEELQTIAIDSNADAATRRRAILTLATSGQAIELFPTLRKLISDKSLTTAVTQALVNCDQPEVANVVLNRFPHMDPDGKVAAINTLVARQSWALRLLDAIETGQLPPEFLTAAHARQIKNFDDDELTQRLTTVWGQIRESSSERLQQIDSLRQQLVASESKTVDLEQGRMLFEKNCASCHTLFGTGGRIGPDLTGSDRKNLNYLLENIIDPSASVAESYRSSVVALDDGRLLTGVVLEQNERTLRLQTKDEIVTIDRNSIENMRQTKNSLMPDGLIDKMTEQEVADLFGFLTK
jgi:putative membrane-bound dehydrogenase-like protein